MEIGEASASVATKVTGVHGASTSEARRLLLFFWALGLSMLTALLGLLFDGVWHTVNPFEEFWSPPHLLIYSGFGVGSLLILVAVFHPYFRTHPVFGPGLRVPFIAFPVPASLFLVGFGSLQAVLAGFLDSAWHANLGVNETTWSYPHMLVVLGGILMALGLMSGAHSLRRHLGREATWPAVLFAAGLIIIFAFPIAPLVSPPEDLAQRLASAEFYGFDAQTVKVNEAFLAHGIHSGNSLLVPAIVPLALVAPLAMARALVSDRRPRPGASRVRQRLTQLVATRAVVANVAILAGATTSFFLLMRSQPGLIDPSSPVLSDPSLLRGAALGGLAGLLALALPQDLLPRPLRRGLPGPLNLLSDRPGPAAAGLLLALLHGLRFGYHPLGLLLAPFAGVGGALLGEGVARVAKEPTPRRVGVSLLLLAIVLPPAFGMIDLYLRLWF